MKNICLSALMGVLALIFINLSFPLTGVSLSINVSTILISSVLGITGVISMIILGYLLL